MRRQRKVSHLIVALVIATTGLCLGILLTVINMPLEGGAIALLGFGPVYLSLDRKHTPDLLIGPLGVFFFFHALSYSIGPLAQRYILHFENYIEEGMIRAQWGAALGLATFALVYHIVFRGVIYRFRKSEEQRVSTITSESEWRRYTALLVAISGLLLIYGYQSGGMRRIGTIDGVDVQTFTALYTFINVQYVAFFFLGTLAVKRRGWWIVLAVFLSLFYAVFQTLEGNRGQLIYSSLMLATGTVWAGFSVRKTLLALSMVGLILIPLAGVVDLYRSNTSALKYDEGFLERLSVFVQFAKFANSGEATPGEKVANQAGIFAISTLTVDRIMAMTPDIIPHAGFDNMDAVFYVYMPAVLAPNRPDIDDGNIIAFDYGVGEGKGARSWVYTPSVGDGFRRFGWLGIPLIYTFSGIIFGASVGICWVKRQKPVWAAMLVFLVLQTILAVGFTFNYLFYFALFFLPKNFFYFFVLKKLQVFITSFYCCFRKPLLRQRVVNHQI